MSLPSHLYRNGSHSPIPPRTAPTGGMDLRARRLRGTVKRGEPRTSRSPEAPRRDDSATGRGPSPPHRGPQEVRAGGVGVNHGPCGGSSTCVVATRGKSDHPVPVPSLPLLPAVPSERRTGRMGGFTRYHGGTTGRYDQPNAAGLPSRRARRGTKATVSRVGSEAGCGRVSPYSFIDGQQAAWTEPTAPLSPSTPPAGAAQPIDA